MQSQYAGPYVIIKFTSAYTCLLMRCQDGKQTKRPVHVQRLRKPRVRDKAFLKRLQIVPTSKLKDPEETIKAKLSHRDVVLIGAGVASHRNHSKAATKTIKINKGKMNMGAMFNSTHQDVAFKNTLADVKG